MSQNTVGMFEHTIETTNIWLNEIMETLGWHDKQRAYHALRAVLHTLRDRLTVEGASHLSAQLPLLIRGMFYEGYHPAGKPNNDRRLEDFLGRVAERFAENDCDYREVTQAVIQVLSNHISDGEIDKLMASMPKDIRDLWAV